MSIGKLYRWLYVVLTVTGCSVAAASCGSGGSTSAFGNGHGGDASFADVDTVNETGTFGNESGSSCQARTCASQGYECGQNGDGCGGTLTCGTCTLPQFCGGGGYSKCGGNSGIGPDGGSTTCTPITCAHLGYTCGPAGDGCGGQLDCGACTSPQYCGGGGFAKCGGNDGKGSDGGNTCTPVTCSSAPGGPYNCGAVSNGCGGVINCGTCVDPQFCGGASPNVCGGNNGLGMDGGVPCVPLTTCPGGQNCGFAANGCGGVLTCGTCTDPQYCGAVMPNVCGGNNGLGPDGGPICTPTTCAALSTKDGFTVCGQQGDGCGGVLTCASCTLPQTCGGGGIPSECGGNNGVGPDGGPLCTPKTCANFAPTICGVQGDGCGGVTAYCNPCTLPDTCGGGGTPNQCGNSNLAPDGGNPCTALTTCPSPENCGQASDGCGGEINCGTCTIPQYCSGGGVYNVCGGNDGLGPDGGPICVPTTCAALGYTCGTAGDGCGNILNCDQGLCPASQCGLGGYDQCPGGGSTCDSGSTTVSGYVFDPGGVDPIYNALVYVPYGPVQQPETGVNSGTCGCVAPPALSSTNTAVDGSFTLSLPNGTTQIVIQLGKWQITYAVNPAPCTNTVIGATCNNTTVPGGQCLTLPSDEAPAWPALNQQNCATTGGCTGNIPLFAVDTGAVDTMECVLLKMGINQAEFVNPNIVGGIPTATGRVQFYQGAIVNGGAFVGGGSPAESALTETASVMNSYDVILFPCQGGPAGGTGSTGGYTGNGYPNSQANLDAYTAVGGRAFTTHFHYDLLAFDTAAAPSGFEFTAAWTPNANGNEGNLNDGTVVTSFARGAALAQWLADGAPFVYDQTGCNAASLPGCEIPVDVVRNDFSAVNAPSQLWMNSPSAGIPLHFTFDTPYNVTPVCGRMVYSDFHVEDCQGGCNAKQAFPAECTSSPEWGGGVMTPQEKLLEFMLFDLTSCVGNGVCTPLTCATAPGGPYNCGQQGDGCGGTLNCGTCTPPDTCGGGGSPGMCGYPDAGCIPATCASLGIQCGEAGDGCGGTLMCPPCNPPQTCGGGGVPNQCGYPDAGCTPLTCAAFPKTTCGPQADGCGGQTAYCNPCTLPLTCDNSQCVAPDGSTSCISQTCTQLGLACGPADDGCGNLIQCGPCKAGMACESNMCVPIDAGDCTPLTCADFTECGIQGDGCGGETPFCNPCTPPMTCGGGGVGGVCGYPDGGVCTPLTCSDFPSTTCGEQGDGCGGVTKFCNPCTPPDTCGGGGKSNMCGAPDAGSCVPMTCKQENIGCGPAGDGCGGLIQCGTCTPPMTCGGGGMPGQCGTPDGGMCKALTCAEQNITCGPAGDGCGNLLQCGTCTPPMTCGGGGTAGQCGGGAQ